MPSFLKSLVHWIVQIIGAPVIDQRTGRNLGKALLLPGWRTIRLVGLHTPYVRAVFLPEDRIRYGRHRIAFATQPPVDFPRILPPPEPQPPLGLPAHPGDGSPVPTSQDFRVCKPGRSRSAGSVAAAPRDPLQQRFLICILVHHSPEKCREILAKWADLGYDPSQILLVHGGSRAEFDRIDIPNAIFIDDLRLRTTRHPVEKQSYTAAFREISRWLVNKPFSHIAFFEYDHRPLIRDLPRKFLGRLADEEADVLFHHLQRVDQTNAPHYLHHLADPLFSRAWKALSLREDPHLVLNCMATGSVWTREAFDAVAAHPEPTPIYLEMHLPTTAHHLGFRVRDLPDQNPFVSYNPHTPAGIPKSPEAWTLHPVKS